jgi:hypothetical protein
MKHTEHELFPAPPLNFSQLKFTLIHNVYFRTSTRKSTIWRLLLFLAIQTDLPKV